jgi:FkbM family methyltransferase
MLKNLLSKLRRSPFDFPVPGGGTIGQIVCAPLDSEAFEFSVIDLGARNGMHHLPASYARRSRLIAFEPNAQEYQKLASGMTDMATIGMSAPAFKRQEYHPYAVWRVRERRQFYVTAGAGACTLMGESLHAVTDRMYRDQQKARQRPFSALTKVLRAEPVDCVALDDVIAADTIVDFMKIDVEGAELACLKGGSRLLEGRRILFICSEFVTLPYYESHDVLGAQHLFLTERGFRLLDFDFRHPTYRRCVRDLPESTDRRLVYAGDAFFALDPDRVAMEPLIKQRLAAIAFVFGFSSFAISLLEDAGLTPASDIDRIAKSVRQTMTTRRLKMMWNRFPLQIMGALR